MTTEGKERHQKKKKKRKQKKKCLFFFIYFENPNTCPSHHGKLTGYQIFDSTQPTVTVNIVQ